MRIYAVLDTNVVVSALLGGGSPPREVLNAALTGRLMPLMSDAVLREYTEVLSRSKFCFDFEDIKTVLEGLCEKAVFVEASPTGEVFPDPDDAVFYEIAVKAGAADGMAYLVTGNIKHFPSASFVVTPRDMLDIINEAG